VRTIEDLTTPGDAAASSQIKTLVYMQTTQDGEQQPVLSAAARRSSIVRNKVCRCACAQRAAAPTKFELLGANAGSLGGVNAKQKATEKNRELSDIADSALQNRRNMTTGANRDNFHLRGVDVNRDISD